MLTIGSLELIRMLHQVIWMSHKSVYSDVKGLSLWSKKNSNNDSSTGFQIKTLTSVSKDLWSEWYRWIYDLIRTEISIQLKIQNNATILLREKRINLFCTLLTCMWMCRIKHQFSPSKPRCKGAGSFHIHRKTMKELWALAAPGIRERPNLAQNLVTHRHW